MLENTTNIMVVENNTNDSAIAKVMLRLMGYRNIKMVKTVKKAIELLRSSQFDIVIAGGDLPNKGAITLRDKVHSMFSEDHPLITVIAYCDPLRIKQIEYFGIIFSDVIFKSSSSFLVVSRYDNF